MQHGNFGQKMAVAKYPDSYSNTSHIEIVNGVFWSRHQHEADHAKKHKKTIETFNWFSVLSHQNEADHAFFFNLSLRKTMNCSYKELCMIL